MSEADGRASAGEGVVHTGRPLDEDGEPMAGPALALDPTGRAAELLRETDRPLVSSPGAGTWAALLARPDEDDVDRPVLLQWLAPGATEPPHHVHPTDEAFEALSGKLTVVVDGEERRLAPGEESVVPAGAEHSFRNDTAEAVAFRAALPSMRTVRALYSVWGLDHEGAYGGDGEFGEPGGLHALLVSEYLHDETTVTGAPLALHRFLWATVGRAARAFGHEVVDDRFLRDEFWERRVEQPDL